uniref:Arrestin C-terminal-like domain-containing protein n=1 Tax=Wuchereria bancrofti TaxID=6293 RepID=A0AAF5PXV8_WUCBA
MASSSNMKDTFSDENLPYHVDILLSKKIYNPGDTIHGEVIFTLEKNLSCDLINVQLFGLIRVFWIDKKAGNGCFRPLPREQKRVMIDETAILWSEDKINCKKPTQPTLNDISRLSTTIAIRANKHERNGNFRGIETGSHKFKFTFQLPKEGLYTSFDLGNCDGRVRYCINVQCFSYGLLMLKQTLLFPIVCPVDPSECLDALKNSYKRKRVEFKKGCYLDVELSVSKRWLVPGEAIPVQVYIDNRSGKSIKFSHLSIRQHVFCIATHPLKCAKEWFQDTLAGVGMDAHKIPNGSKYKYVPNFNVPALIPGFEINGCMTLEYDLKLDVGFDRITMSSDMKHIVCTLTIPIFIGTSSITDTNILQKSKFQEAAVSPPNYYDISPPSYDECFSKNPVVNETAD